MLPAIETFWLSLLLSLALSLVTLLSIRAWRAYTRRTGHCGAGSAEASDVESKSEAPRTAVDQAEHSPENPATPVFGTHGDIIAAPVRHAAKSQRQRRILVMDDERLIRSVAVKSLSHAGYEVEVTDDPHQAIQLCRQALESGRRYDLALLDLSIPGTPDGTGTLLQLREIDPDLQGIVSSDDSSDPVMIDYQSHGFAARLAKPFRSADLLEILREVLEGHPAHK
jgi:CheY-like chemotaxis protein